MIYENMCVQFWQELQTAEYQPEKLCLLNTRLILYGNLHTDLEGWVLLSDSKLVFYKSPRYVCIIKFSNPEINLCQFHYINICKHIHIFKSVEPCKHTFCISRKD